MNTPIRRLFVVFVLMFAALLGATTWWTVVRSDSLNRDHADQNRRDLLRGIKIRRGDIRAADGTLIAHSRKDSQGVYDRRYPQGEVFGHPSATRTPAWARPSWRRTTTASSRAGRHHQLDPPAARRQPGGRRRPAHDDRPRGAEARRAADRAGQPRAGRRGGRARPADRRGQGHGVGAGLRPQRRQAARRAAAPQPRRDAQAAGQPRAPVRLRPRVDDEGRHARRGARQRQVPARLARRRHTTT